MQEIKLSYFSIPGIIRQLPCNSETILKYVCEYFNQDKNDILGKRRYRDFVTSRHIAMYLIRTQTNLTVLNIGKMFYRDHTTVINAMSKINGFLDIKDRATINAIETISNNLRTNN